MANPQSLARKLGVRSIFDVGCFHIRSAFNKWRYISVFLLGAACIGLAAAVFSKLGWLAHLWLYRWLELAPFLPLIVMPLSFAFLLWITRSFFFSAQGGGISQTIATLEHAKPEFKNSLLSMTTVWSKMGLTVLGQACGAPLGREGPMIHIGASIMYVFGRFIPNDTWTKRQLDYSLILAGGAAGVAAAFHAPLAGVMFAIEELSHFRARAKSLGIVVLIVMVASLVAACVASESHFFGHADVHLILLPHWGEILICGVACGLAGGIFSRFLISPAKILPRRIEALRLSSPIWFAALCGFIIAVLGVLSHNTIYGNGSREAQLLMQDPNSLPGVYASFKFAATWIAFLSSIPGGIFAPSLSIGAGIGANLSALLPAVPPDVIILLCIAGFFAGMAQAPVTACLIIMEMNGSYSMIWPLMAVACTASLCSRLICPQPVYHVLAQKLLLLSDRKT